MALRITRGYALLGLALAGSVVGLGVWMATAPKPAFSESTTLLEGGNADKGKAVFAAGDCASCHASPGQPDRLKLGGGLSIASPFGTFRAPNISSDPMDGIGRWRPIDLANALISGVSPAGAHYYPVLPYPSYVQMKTEDVKDLMAFLRTLPPVSGRAPPHELNPLFRIRRFVGMWKLLFLEARVSEPSSAAESQEARGRYLVETLAHCAECHSSRNVLGAIKPATRFAGGPNPEGLGFAPNITPQRLQWSREQLIEMLTSGYTPHEKYVGAGMAGVVSNTAQLPESDREAMATYVQSLPARTTPLP